MDMNKMAEKLSVQKRRVYDMTCVLEGISALTRIRTNVMKWDPPSDMVKHVEDCDKNKESDSYDDDDDDVVGEPAICRSRKEDKQVEDLQKEISRLQEKEKQLDSSIRSEMKKIQELTKRPESFITTDDVLRTRSEKVVVILSVPAGTDLRVPDPYLLMVPMFQLELTTFSGFINVRTLRNNPSAKKRE